MGRKPFMPRKPVDGPLTASTGCYDLARTAITTLGRPCPLGGVGAEAHEARPGRLSGYPSSPRVQMLIFGFDERDRAKFGVWKDRSRKRHMYFLLEQVIQRRRPSLSGILSGRSRTSMPRIVSTRFEFGLEQRDEVQPFGRGLALTRADASPAQIHFGTRTDPPQLDDRPAEHVLIITP
jgi:hypothetical protein